MRGTNKSLVAGMLQVIVLLAENMRMLQGTVGDLDRMCKRRGSRIWNGSKGGIWHTEMI